MTEWQRLSDTEWIFLILAIIYLWECSCWVRAEAACFSLGIRRHHLLGRLTPIANPSGRLVITNPLPLTTAFLCAPWPIPLDEHGVVVSEGGLPVGPGGDESDSSWIPYDAIDSIAQAERHVIVNGRTIVTVALPEQAAFVAARLRRVWSTAAGGRREAIEDVFDEVMDAKGVAARLTALKQRSSTLRRWSALFLVYTFGLGPCLYYGSDALWAQTAWSFVAGFLALWLLVVVRYYSARRMVCQEQWASRLWHVIMLVFSPGSAMRSGEKLLRSMLATFDPLPVAAVLCSSRQLVAIGGPRLRALRHPAPTSRMAGDSSAGRAETWFCRQMLVRAERVLRDAGVDTAELLSEPLRLSSAQSYCPRCLGQYVTGEGCCFDCGGVSLVPFLEPVPSPL